MKGENKEWDFLTVFQKHLVIETLLICITKMMKKTVIIIGSDVLKILLQIMAGINVLNVEKALEKVIWT